MSGVGEREGVTPRKRSLVEESGQGNTTSFVIKQIQRIMVSSENLSKLSKNSWNKK